MGEYRVKVSVRNNLLLKAIEDTGAKSVAEFCRINDLSTSTINALICMRIKPITEDGDFCFAAKDVMEVLGACPTDLWTTEQLNLRLGRNSKELVVDKETLQGLIGGQATPLTAETPEDLVGKSELAHVVDAVLDRLTLRERQVLDMRYKQDMTLEEVAVAHKVSRERVRQVEAKALRKLRDPKRGAELRTLLDRFDGNKKEPKKIIWEHDPEAKEVIQYEDCGYEYRYDHNDKLQCVNVRKRIGA